MRQRCKHQTMDGARQEVGLVYDQNILLKLAVVVVGMAKACL